jgi:hypothetical protein
MLTPTPYSEVNATLSALLDGARGVLGDRFVGLYLYGSLAYGDFDPERSDVDFLVVTDGLVDAATAEALAEMHARLWASGGRWARKLEGAYLPRALLRRYDPAEPPSPYVNEGRFSVGPLGVDWIIQRHVLREQGIAVAGPDLKPLIDPVSPDELRACVRDNLGEWWAPMLETPDARLDDGGYQSYAVLSMCRTLHTLATGINGTKVEAAQWAMATLPARWKPLIAWASDWRPGDAGGHRVETLEFIRYTVDAAQA